MDSDSSLQTRVTVPKSAAVLFLLLSSYSFLSFGSSHAPLSIISSFVRSAPILLTLFPDRLKASGPIFFSRSFPRVFNPLFLPSFFLCLGLRHFAHSKLVIPLIHLSHTVFFSFLYLLLFYFFASFIYLEHTELFRLIFIFY